MESGLQFLAIFSCAIFAGAALYINLVEHPARMKCDLKVALAEWIPSYKKATFMQAPLALVGSLAAVTAWLMGADMAWLIGGLLLGSVIPYTFIWVMPTNKRLLSQDPAKLSADLGYYLQRWNVLHLVRSIFSISALIIFLLNR